MFSMDYRKKYVHRTIYRFHINKPLWQWRIYTDLPSVYVEASTFLSIVKRKVIYKTVE